MYPDAVRQELKGELATIRNEGRYKDERVIVTPQGARIRVQGGREVLNFCANNYLGLSSHPRIIVAAKKALDDHGYGMSSVRFICGTQDLHKDLERAAAQFLGMEDSILYVACWDANGGLFETLLGEGDAIVSDALNHASIIDGIRLCKAARFRYANADMNDLESKLKEARAGGAKRVMIATDGVFSMDGNIAPLKEICALAERFDAMVMVDDSHATGFIGETGRGTPEQCGVVGRVDVITSTLGKALGGASGGFTASRREIVDVLRNRSRPYLFSNTLPPPIAAGALEAFRLLSTTGDLVKKLKENTKRFREGITKAGFDVKPGVTPIVPIMLYDERKAHDMAKALLEKGIYVIGFSYPVVPKGQARIRVQLSAAHSPDDIDRCVAAFADVSHKP
ncbi:MAG TPA: glycine C-acetyltransferase [Planctomycetota bacterium]|nr:glycine C-acetyltransferase [Planctomycetota bacterium]